LAWGVALAPPVILLVLLIEAAMRDALPVDWQTYVRGSDALLSGQSPYASFQLAGPYSLDQAAAGAGYVYPPSAAVLMAPFLRPFPMWATLNVGLYVLGLLAVIWRHGALRPTAVAFSLLFAWVWPGLGDAISHGGVSPAIAGGLALAYAGVPTAGLGAALKVFPVAWITISGSIRLTAASLLVPILISLIFAGFAPWRDFVIAFANGQPDCGHSMASLRCVPIPLWAIWAIGIGMVAAIPMVPRAWALLLLGAMPLVVAPEIWPHYLLMVAPGIVAITFRIRRPPIGWVAASQWTEAKTEPR